MNKKEFLSFSLPYGVYVQEDAHISKLEGVVQGYYLIDYNEIGTEERDDVLPILHPLSDLTKPIKHKGEEFVPKKRMIELFLGTMPKSLNFDWLYFQEVQKLLEWHFDIADLISKGEAIDVNTLEFNPYE